jgi:LysM repeat protein
MASQAAKVLSIAKVEEGYREGFSGGHWNNKEKYANEVPGMAWVSAGGYPWCALFVSWVALKAGVSDLYPRSASCAYGVNWFRQKGRFSEYPAVGAQVFFGPGGGTHTGLVVGYDATTITTVEGNTNTDGSPEGNGVYLRKRDRKSANTYGYGLPAFAEGVTTADPSLKGKAGYHYAAKASAPVGASSTATHAKPSSSKTKAVVVKSGQTLGVIAASAGVSLAVVLGLNPGIKDANVIQPGQKVTVPASAPKASSTPKATTEPKTTTKPKASAKPTKSQCK